MAGIRGMYRDHDLQTLAQVCNDEKVKALPKDHIILEIGSFVGKSLIFMVGVSGRDAISVDPHFGEWTGRAGLDKRAMFGDTEQELHDNIKKFDMVKKITVVRARSRDYRPTFKTAILHIDGDHSYEEVLADLREYSPVVAKDGLIVLHDHNLPDVKYAVSAFLISGEDCFVGLETPTMMVLRKA